ncbi:hypothetical protein RM555_09165 [Micromonospora sp. DSM 115977]|uniref:Uncharacterized protein n=1 Tax=Micromonospora reichwaldensis TaxID=3075516 RepID=A0ABU2WUB5_9ACTN|nr:MULTISPECIES: hypothetical protein [unclassified Micromonospora]MDT0529160.1 hypothetical protein [Micromonospora sp. DSM 115977]WSF99748.1 hypothetical protein OG989_18770 [Micromonospora sp. NBC_01740]
MIESWRSRLSGLWRRHQEPAQPVTFSAELRSCHPHVAFDATFQLRWHGDDQAALWTTRQKLTEWADQESARYCVTQAGNAENDINARIAYGARVHLAVSRQARAAAEAILDIGRQTTLEHLKQQTELERIRYLRESVYSRPDVARSYWLYHHPDQLNTMLNIDFEGIARKFGDAEESRFLVIAKLIDDFFGRLEDGERRYLLGQLGKIFSSYDRPDLAESLEAS